MLATLFLCCPFTLLALCLHSTLYLQTLLALCAVPSCKISLWNATSLSVERWQQQNTNAGNKQTQLNGEHAYRYMMPWWDFLKNYIPLCLHCTIAPKKLIQICWRNRHKVIAQKHGWLIKLRNRRPTLNPCVNKTCVEFFTLTLLSRSVQLSTHCSSTGGSWQRWGFDSQFFVVFFFVFLSRVKLSAVSNCPVSNCPWFQIVRQHCGCQIVAVSNCPGVKLS